MTSRPQRTALPLLETESKRAPTRPRGVVDTRCKKDAYSALRCLVALQSAPLVRGELSAIGPCVGSTYVRWGSDVIVEVVAS